MAEKLWLQLVRSEKTLIVMIFHLGGVVQRGLHYAFRQRDFV